jgi:hypothetical protein
MNCELQVNILCFLGPVNTFLASKEVGALMVNL